MITLIILKVLLEKKIIKTKENINSTIQRKWQVSDINFIVCKCGRSDANNGIYQKSK